MIFFYYPLYGFTVYPLTVLDLDDDYLVTFMGCSWETISSRFPSSVPNQFCDKKPDNSQEHLIFWALQWYWRSWKCEGCNVAYYMTDWLCFPVWGPFYAIKKKLVLMALMKVTLATQKPFPLISLHNSVLESWGCWRASAKKMSVSGIRIPLLGQDCSTQGWLPGNGVRPFLCMGRQDW